MCEPRPAILQEPSPNDCIMTGAIKELTGGDRFLIGSLEDLPVTTLSQLLSVDYMFGRFPKISEDGFPPFKPILYSKEVPNIHYDESKTK